MSALDVHCTSWRLTAQTTNLARLSSSRMGSEFEIQTSLTRDHGWGRNNPVQTWFRHLVSVHVPLIDSRLSRPVQMRQTVLGWLGPILLVRPERIRPIQWAWPNTIDRLGLRLIKKKFNGSYLNRVQIRIWTAKSASQLITKNPISTIDLITAMKTAIVQPDLSIQFRTARSVSPHFELNKAEPLKVHPIILIVSSFYVFNITIWAPPFIKYPMVLLVVIFKFSKQLK